MGKKGKTKGSKTPTTSGGCRHIAKAKKQICRLKMKIKRWDRYRTAGKSVSPLCNRSRQHDWSTAGLQKQLRLYEKIAASSAKRP